MNITLTYHSSAMKFIHKQNESSRQRIFRALEGLKKIPPSGDIRKMGGMKNTYRLRVGSIRIVYLPNYSESAVYIRAIDNRGDIY